MKNNSTLQVSHLHFDIMSSSSVDTFNWGLRYVADTYTKKTMLSKGCGFFLNKYKATTHACTKYHQTCLIHILFILK